MRTPRRGWARFAGRAEGAGAGVGLYVYGSGNGLGTGAGARKMFSRGSLRGTRGRSTGSGAGAGITGVGGRGPGCRVRSPPRRGPPPGEGLRRGRMYSSQSLHHIPNMASGTLVGISGSVMGSGVRRVGTGDRRGAGGASFGGGLSGRLGAGVRVGRAGRPRRAGRRVRRRAGRRRGCGAGAGFAPAKTNENGD